MGNITTENPLLTLLVTSAAWALPAIACQSRCLSLPVQLAQISLKMLENAPVLALSDSNYMDPGSMPEMTPFLTVSNARWVIQTQFN